MHVDPALVVGLLVSLLLHGTVVGWLVRTRVDAASIPLLVELMAPTVSVTQPVVRARATSDAGTQRAPDRRPTVLHHVVRRAPASVRRITEPRLAFSESVEPAPAPPVVPGGEQPLAPAAEAPPIHDRPEPAAVPAAVTGLTAAPHPPAPLDTGSSPPVPAGSPSRGGLQLEAALPPRDGDTGAFVAPRLTYEKKPRYPEAARQEGAEGTVLVRAHVLADGSVREARVAKSAGNEALDTAALETIREARFAPAHRGGKPVAVWVEVPIDFRLRR